MMARSGKIRVISTSTVIDTPRLALACASREVLRMADKVEAMLRRTIDMFQTTDREAIGRLVKMDDEVDKMYDEIKLYIAKISRKELTSDEASLSMRLSDFNIKLEHIGDIIERNLTRLATKRAEGDLEFSKEGWGEIVDLHARVVANMQLALNVLVSSDVESARELLSEKSAIRELERESSDRHLARLAAGQVSEHPHEFDPSRRDLRISDKSTRSWLPSHTSFSTRAATFGRIRRRRIERDPDRRPIRPSQAWFGAGGRPRRRA